MTTIDSLPEAIRAEYERQYKRHYERHYAKIIAKEQQRIMEEKRGYVINVRD